MNRQALTTVLVTTLLLTSHLPVQAAPDAVTQLLDEYRAQGATAFSEQRGEALWRTDFAGRRCSSCHTEDPRAPGRHQKTRKLIEPLAPSANANRLTKAKSVRKWLKRNCKWTLGRECTAQEKGDFLTWLMRQ